MKATFRGGLPLPRSSKLPTCEVPVRDFAPDRVYIPMNMHTGAASQPCVRVGDRVKLGQMIAEPVGALGLPVHASVSGTVESEEPIDFIDGSKPLCITIVNDRRDEWAELHPLGSVEEVDPALIVPAIKAAGICGLGGAAFPTHVKLSLRPEQKCETIIANGAECETHLTCCHRQMVEDGGRIVDGLRAAMRALGVKDGVIAIEDNKPDAIANMKKLCEGRKGVRVLEMKTKYPQGSEKQLIEAVTGKQVPSGGLPIHAGAIVLDVLTCAAIADAITEGKPLVQRITTVSGCVKTPSNLRLRIGTLAEDAISACGGAAGEIGKIVFGGLMMGLALPSPDIPAVKATGGILLLTPEESAEPEETACIRCGRCSMVCPIRLRPYALRQAADAGDLERCRALHVMDCVQCGSCSYICPAKRRLTERFKKVKDEIAAQAKKGGAEE